MLRATTIPITWFEHDASPCSTNDSTPLRIQAALPAKVRTSARPRGTVVPAAIAPGLASSLSGKYSPDRSSQDVEIQPDRPIAHVENVIVTLRVEVTGASHGYLPESGRTRSHTMAQLARLRRDL